jgi:hypothetical protein
MSHGTMSGVWRHHNRKEPLCEACIPLWAEHLKDNRVKKKARQIHTDNAEVKSMDALLEDRPPRITRRKNNHGIWVHTSIDDPYPDGGHNSTKTHCKRGHEFTPESTMPTATGRECRICKNAYKREAWRASRAFPAACERGHEFDSWNTIVNPDGSFECRICTEQADNTPLMTAARTLI